MFLSASVRNCILNLNKARKNNFNTRFINGEILNSNYKSNNYKDVSKKLLIENIDGWLNIFYQDNDTISIINKLRESSNILNDFTEISQGLIPYDKYKGHSQETIKNRIWHADYKKDDTYKKELQGKDLERYKLEWNGKRWISYGEWLAAPRKPEFFNNKRILIREITNPRILASYVEDEYYNSPSIINIINFQDISPFYLLGIINSKLLSFYHNKTSPKANKGLFPKILVNDVRKLPIQIADGNLYNLLINKVEELIGLLKDNIANDAITIDKEIDNIVYNIYGINDKEIKIIEKNF